MQTVRDGRDYIEFEFAAKAGGYIRHALAVVTVGNGAQRLMQRFPIEWARGLISNPVLPRSWSLGGALAVAVVP